MTRRVRAAAGFVAAVAWLGEALFLTANARAFGSVAKSLWWTTRFLTDWTGLLMAFVATAFALRWKPIATAWWAGLATVAGTLVGLMFAMMGGRANLHFDTMLGVSSALAHVVAPWAMLFVWMFVLDHGALCWRDAPRFMLFPLLYLLQMITRGLLGDGYPYPEVDLAKVGTASALAFAGAVTILFFVLGLLLVGSDRLLAKRSRSTASNGG